MGTKQESPYEVLDNTFRVALVGESGVGKTTIAKKFTEDVTDEQRRYYTRCVQLGERIIQVQFLDMKYKGNQERFLFDCFCKPQQGAVIVFDASCYNAAKDAQTWLQSILSMSDAYELILIGNKSDLKGNNGEVNSKMKNFANANRIPLYYTSAISDESIEIALFALLKQMAKKVPSRQQANSNCSIA